MVAETDEEKAQKVFKIQSERLGGDVQGHAVIAMNIWAELVVEGESDPVVAGGYLTSCTGWRRAHWWMEKNGKTFDPMGDEYKNEPGFKHEVAHRGHWHDFCREYNRQKFGIRCRS